MHIQKVVSFMTFDEESQEYGDVSSLADERDVRTDGEHVDNLVLRSEPDFKTTNLFVQPAT